VESRFTRLADDALSKSIGERSAARFYRTLDNDDSGRAAIDLVSHIRGKRCQRRAIVDQIAKPTGASDDRFESIIKTHDACVAWRWRNGQDRKRCRRINRGQQIADPTLDGNRPVRLDCGPPLLLSMFLHRHS
jgi:hypothetical protein